MTHLDRDVAAFVDGQLSPDAAALARQHVAECTRCRDAVSQQRLLKSRMQTGSVPGPPPSLLASLCSVPSIAAEPESRRERWRRSPAVGAGAALVGASLLVVALAFVVGAHEHREADPVHPTFDDYTADFVIGYGTATDTMTSEALAALSEQGWPCHPELAAGDLQRVDGRWHGENGDTVSLTYTDGRERLRLYEKAGTLDDDALHGFALRTMGERRVWIREGDPTVATWDADGIVFIAVTDVDEQRLAAAVSELPEPREPRDAAARMGDGLDRMTSWVSP
ncbi:anti-sigma factor family protein [Aeromicrobium sp. CTD01-1L150]|uniref:anti-sigma factor family protein n=1 Tax=Aeromicrobium sp. CTD01-1L150 TaxID=3341830 RepID=UPI0035C1DF57